MRHRIVGILLIGLFSLAVANPVPANESAGEVARWEFDVYLNDKRVGTHSFEVMDIGGIRQVRSDASFNYKILFISAYRYQHNASERWEDNCLLGFEARTNANGDRIQVFGEQTGAGFRVDAGNSPVELPECVMSFAYWNPAFLDQSRLLNPQTGEYVDVNVEQVAEELLVVRGDPVAAKKYRLTAYGVDLTLWYSADNQWLALESVAEGGHIIRYELA